MQRCHEASGAEMVTVAVRTAMLARAMNLAVESGRMPRKLSASASSPLTGVVGSVERPFRLPRRRPCRRSSGNAGRNTGMAGETPAPRRVG
jgi:thiazole synthase ThiGH ThiG subunit